jgi:hypothetical protein
MTDCKSFNDDYSSERAQIFKNLSHELSRIGNSAAFRYLRNEADKNAGKLADTYSIFKSRKLVSGKINRN